MARIANRSRSFVGRSGGLKRATLWISSSIPTTTTSLAAATAILHQSFSSAQLDAVAQAGGTIVRTRGTFWVATDQVVASEDAVGALGMMVVRDAARAAGVASLPTPTTEAEDDAFFVHQWWQSGMNFIQNDATGFQVTGNLWKQYDFDSKAQRKFTPEDAIVVTVENSNASFGCQFMLAFRMLIKPGASR